MYTIIWNNYGTSLTVNTINDIITIKILNIRDVVAFQLVLKCSI
jgi:hypothetical protein